MKDGPLSLTSLDVQNILRLKAVRLTLDPEGALVIEGKNEQGKSSVLKSLELLLAGGKETPDAPLHGDSTKGHIIATFGDIIVKKVFKKGKRPALTITTAEGARMQAPQTMLDKLLSHVSLDPVSFMDKTDKEQTVILSDLMGFDSKEYDAEIERIFNLRTDANREAKRLAAVVTATTFDEDAPDDEVSVSELMAELKKRQAHNATLDAKQDAVHDAERKITAFRDEETRLLTDGQRAAAEIQALKVQIAGMETDQASRRTNLASAKDATTKAQADAKTISLEHEKMDTANEDEITDRIAAADDINAGVRANVERAKAKTESDAAANEAAKLNTQLEDEKAKREKARLAARENLPIPDLDISESAVLYKGKPLSQAGKSAELRVSVAVAIALNKDKRVKLLLIDDAEKLDADNVKLVMEMAAAANFQVIMARVGDGKTASVVIEDGEVKA